MAAIVAILPQDATKARRVMDKTPLNPNGRKLRKFEKDGEARIYDALQKWGRALFRGVTADTVALLTARLDDREFNKPLRDAMITFLQEVADAGAEHGRAQIEQVFMGVKRIPDVAAGAVDWTAANTDAAQWAIEYGYQLINGITDTTRAQVAREIRYFVDNSISIGQLRDRLMAGNLFSRNRAEMIAITEVTRAFAEGNTAAWKASKVVEGREWMTAVDERVCPMCGPLHAQIAKMGEPFKGGVDNPPRHVRCRCWVLPVVIGDTEIFPGFDELMGGGSGAGVNFPAALSIDDIDKLLDQKRKELESQNPLISSIRKANPAMTDDDAQMYADVMMMDRAKFAKYAKQLGLDDIDNLIDATFNRDAYTRQQIAMLRQQLRSAGTLENHSPDVSRSIFRAIDTAKRRDMSILEWRDMFRDVYGVDINISGQFDDAALRRALSELDAALTHSPAARRVASDNMRAILFDSRGASETQLASWLPGRGTIRIPEFSGTSGIDAKMWIHELGHGAEDYLSPGDISAIFDRGRRVSSYAWTNPSEDFAETFMHMASGEQLEFLKRWIPDKYQYIMENIPGF